MVDKSSVLYKKRGFTIVELLVVIVVIGILAAITIVSYSGISSKAIAVSLQSDLDNNSKLLKMYNVEYGYYPNFPLDSNNCPLTPTPDTRYCLKTSTDTSLVYAGNDQKFTIAVNKNNINYRVTESKSPYQVTADTGWLIIGTQTWATTNLNIGTMITGVSTQTDNGGTNTVEKYCYSDIESNCSTYGGLYQWDEAMKYTNTEGAQGICPDGSHIPSDNDWKILEMQLGMSRLQSDATGNRGTNQGTNLQSGGSSGLNMSLAGVRYTSGSFDGLLSYVFMLSSSESSTRAWDRILGSGNQFVLRGTDAKTIGYSVRCLGN